MDFLNDIDTLGQINIALWLLFFIVYNVIMFSTGLIKAAKGEDGVLQVAEWFFIAWAISYGFFLFSVMGLSIEAPNEVYTMLEIIGPFATLGKVGKDGFNMWQNKKNQDDEFKLE